MGKTITTYLINNSAQGAQYSFISNRMCKMYLIPRANISVVNERKELQRPAFYILLGEDQYLEPKAYLGETENFKERVKDHDNKKIFWQKALVFISKDKDITKADVQYLEFLAINAAVKAKQFSIEENKQLPKAPNLPEHQMDTIESFFEDVKLLTSFNGYNIFDIIEQQNNHLFYIKNRGANAIGFYNENGFTVLKESLLACDHVDSFSWKEKRLQMLNKYAENINEKLILLEDRTFPSPSAAADFCIGRSANGWVLWKDRDGQTLDEVYRRKLDVKIIK